MKVAKLNTSPKGAAISMDDVANRKPFESVELTWQLLLISKYTRAFMVAKLEKIGLEAGQDQLIHALPLDGSVGVSGVADALNVRASTVSKMADRLVRDGLIQRVPHPSDLRKTNLVLTPDGIAKRAQIEELMVGVEQELSAGLGDSGAEIASMLDRLDATLLKKLKRLR
ncbi:MarR family winged helix-turn-helix transcriptional regulator [Aureimonas psammosilenae]|uniref:MarR family winged helix-turn-helix transcriptional regulator n=1 Tax=Aureimonas psammosilenae TaxID=2495496 RepID=UPI001260714C|nr:MarR family transcriptional regulator [Aureimonas psammosilenae]